MVIVLVIGPVVRSGHRPCGHSAVIGPVVIVLVIGPVVIVLVIVPVVRSGHRPCGHSAGHRPCGQVWS